MVQKTVPRLRDSISSSHNLESVLFTVQFSPDALVPHAETTAAAIDSGVDVGCRGAEVERTDEFVARADAGNLWI